MSETEKKTPGKFCSLAWLQRFTNVGGEIQVCCTSEEMDNNIRDNLGKKMVAPASFSNEEILNSEFMKGVRLKLLEGKWPTFCKRCMVTEESGSISRRMNENRAYEDLTDELISGTKADGSIDVKVRSFDMRLGNQCNLACRMCNPRSSSQWAKAWHDVDQGYFVVSKERLEEFKHYHWYRSPEILKNFKEQVPHLRHLHFAGGEPLLIPEMAKFLEACVESGYAKNIEVSYNTNMTVLPPELKKLWPHFRRVKILASIDGVGPLNEFIRYPSSWKRIDKHLRDIDSNAAEYGVSEVILSCTVQVYNIFRLEELYDYLADGFKMITSLPQLIDLHYPIFYRSQILPSDMKAAAKKSLQTILVKSEKRITDGIIPSHYSYMLDSLRGSLNFLEMEDQTSQIPTFRRVAESLDGFRKEDLYRVIPELEPLKKFPVGKERIELRSQEAINV